MTENPENTEFTYHAQFFDAPDIAGTIEASSIDEAVDAAADDMCDRLELIDTFEYGLLTSLTVTSGNVAVLTITPEYD